MFCFLLLVLFCVCLYAFVDFIYLLTFLLGCFVCSCFVVCMCAFFYVVLLLRVSFSYFFVSSGGRSEG